MQEGQQSEGTDGTGYVIIETMGGIGDGYAGSPSSGVSRQKQVLVVVDRASKFVLAYPLQTKGALDESKNLLELVLTFGVPLSPRSDAGGEFTASVFKHLCWWLSL